MNHDGSGVKRLTRKTGYDGGPWFSPDGKKIAWRSWYPKTKEERIRWKECMENNYIVPFPLDIRVMNSDGTDKKRLTRNGAVNWAPSWFPEGKRLIFSSNMDDWHDEIKKFGHNFELYMINIDGTGLRPADGKGLSRGRRQRQRRDCDAGTGQGTFKKPQT